MVEINELGASKNIHHNQKSIPSSQNLMLILLSMTNWCFNIRLLFLALVVSGLTSALNTHNLFIRGIVMKISEDYLRCVGVKRGKFYFFAVWARPELEGVVGVMRWLNGSICPCPPPSPLPNAPLPPAQPGCLHWFICSATIVPSHEAIVSPRHE